MLGVPAAVPLGSRWAGVVPALSVNVLLSDGFLALPEQARKFRGTGQS
ncbi:hypothetical protein BQ8794_170064 [Mesorhizobium prunaredense]|uniref:Uncharacterized protein n=1 Tax=Mesorhizobium prunaredense TaxID=1631249 RepID=A0A1R3V3U8_9HYPH|nr:hypothetical protein BQ8794_170064 [Mesorhizobium prunaredense]